MTPFSIIYQHDIWKGTESRSGPGSGDAATARIKEDIAALVEHYGVRSVLDVGCGDGYWMPPLPGYVGIDPTPEAIERARVNHPDRAYLCGDIRNITLHADLVIIRDVLQHLDLGEAASVLNACIRRGNMLLASTYRGGSNDGITEKALLKGGAYAANLQDIPFSLPEPVTTIIDGWSYHDPDLVRDPRKMLGLWVWQ